MDTTRAFRPIEKYQSIFFVIFLKLFLLSPTQEQSTSFSFYANAESILYLFNDRHKFIYLILKLTLKSRRNKMLQIPRAKSGSLVLPMFMHNLYRLSTILVDLYLNPRRPCNWAIIIIIAVAEIKPDVTGIDIKSTKNPAGKDRRLSILDEH